MNKISFRTSLLALFAAAIIGGLAAYFALRPAIAEEQPIVEFSRVTSPLSISGFQVTAPSEYADPQVDEQMVRRMIASGPDYRYYFDSSSTFLVRLGTFHVPVVSYNFVIPPISLQNLPPGAVIATPPPDHRDGALVYLITGDQQVMCLFTGGAPIIQTDGTTIPPPTIAPQSCNWLIGINADTGEAVLEMIGGGDLVTTASP